MLSTYPKGLYFQDQVGRSKLLGGWWVAVRKGEGWRTPPCKSPVPPKCRAVLGLRLPSASHCQQSHHAPATPMAPLPQTQRCCLPVILGISTAGSLLAVVIWGFERCSGDKSTCWCCHLGKLREHVLDEGSMSLGADFESLKSCSTSCLLSLLWAWRSRCALPASPVCSCLPVVMTSDSPQL